MDQPKEPNNIEESVAQILQTLPAVVRDYVGHQRYTNVAQGLVTKYSLHIDQGGVLEHGILLLLMGVDTPDEFTQTLKDEARLDDSVIEGIIHDINEQIFIPLQKAERESGFEETSPTPVPTPIAEMAPQPEAVYSDASSVSVLPPRQQTSVPPPSQGTPLPPRMMMPERPQQMREVAPENLPGAMIAPSTQTPERTAPGIPITKSYVVDPYHEPIDDTDEGV